MKVKWMQNWSFTWTGYLIYFSLLQGGYLMLLGAKKSPGKPNFIWKSELVVKKLAIGWDSAIFARWTPRIKIMYWTLELASYLEDAPWPASKDELIDFAMRTGAPLEVVENLQGLQDDGESYETIEDIWPDYPSKEDFFFNEDEY